MSGAVSGYSTGGEGHTRVRLPAATLAVNVGRLAAVTTATALGEMDMHEPARHSQCRRQVGLLSSTHILAFLRHLCLSSSQET